MDQIRINGVLQINRKDRGKFDSIRVLRILPDREGIDFVAYKVNFVSLIKLH